MAQLLPSILALAASCVQAGEAFIKAELCHHATGEKSAIEALEGFDVDDYFLLRRGLVRLIFPLENRKCVVLAFSSGFHMAVVGTEAEWRAKLGK